MRFLPALESLLDRYEKRPAIVLLAHATTIATNALLGQIGLELPRTALVTTDGFRDVIEIGRQNRSALYDLNVQRPRPLVARADRFTVQNGSTPAATCCRRSTITTSRASARNSAAAITRR